MIKSILTFSIGLLIVCFAVAQTDAADNKLAVLLGADWSADTASHNDVVAMREALKQRGFSSEEIVSLDGNLSRTMVVSFLAQVGQRTAAWKSGSVFLYYSGHGTYRRISVAEVEPGLFLNKNLAEAERKLLWREVFAALKLPSAIRLVLLPDS